MALEDIQSPLPPRRVSDIDTPPPVTAEMPKPEPTTTVSSPMAPKAFNKNYLIFGGIGLLILVIIFLIFKVLLPGITGKTAVTTITYWGLWEDKSIISGIIADYEAKNPDIKINYVANQKGNYRTRLQSRLESTTATEGAPDIFRMHSSWLPMLKNDVAKVPTATAQAIGLDSDYFETYKNDIKSGSSWLGVPLMYDGLALFYNKDLIQNGQVALPKSWWDLEMAATKLTVRDEAGRIKVAGAALGLVDNVDNWSDILGLMMKQGGVNPLATDEENTKKMQDVLTFYSLFRTKDKVWDETLPNSTEAFANGKLAFYFAPSWRVFNIEDMKIPSLNYEITTVPQLPTLSNVPMDQANDQANLTNIHWSTYWIEGVNAKSANQGEAWKFLEYLSKAENLEKMYTAASQVRAFGEIYPRKSMADKMMSNGKTAAFVKAANDASGWYLSGRTFDEGLNDGMIKYFGDAINSLVETKTTPEEMMVNLRNGINQMVTKYGLAH